MSEKPVTIIKTFLGNDCRRTRVSGSFPSGTQVMEAVAQSHDLNTDGISMFWKDSEGDWITVTSSDDVAEAIEQQRMEGSATLKLHLNVTANQNTVAPPQEPSNQQQNKDSTIELQRSPEPTINNDPLTFYDALFNEIRVFEANQLTPVCPTQDNPIVVHGKRGALLEQIRNANGQSCLKSTLPKRSHTHTSVLLPNGKRVALLDQIRSSNMGQLTPVCPTQDNPIVVHGKRGALLEQIRNANGQSCLKSKRSMDSTNQSMHPSLLQQIIDKHHPPTRPPKTTQNNTIQGEQNQYQPELQLIKEMGFGYLDQNWLLDALNFCKGDVNTIVTLIMDNASRFNNTSQRISLLKEIRSFPHTNLTAVSSTITSITNNTPCEMAPLPSDLLADIRDGSPTARMITSEARLNARIKSIVATANNDIQCAVAEYKRCLENLE